jgi:hypothetical protein
LALFCDFCPECQQEFHALFGGDDGKLSPQVLAENPNGIQSLSPGLRRMSYPGYTTTNDSTLKGLNHPRISKSKIANRKFPEAVANLKNPGELKVKALKY